MNTFKLDNSIRVAIVDQDLRWSKAMKLLIDDDSSNIVVMAVYKSLPPEKELLVLNPHLILLNADENQLAYKSIKTIKVKAPQIQFLPYSNHPSEEMIFNFISHDCSGFMTEVKFDHKQIVNSILNLKEGKPALSGKVRKVLVSKFYQQTDHNISRKEVEVLQEMQKGKTANEIAISLGVKKNTIRTHMSNIYNKLDANNKAEALELFFNK